MKLKNYKSIFKLAFLSIVSLFFSSQLNAQTPYFYGLTTTGGGGNGSVFRTDTTGANYQILDSFAATDMGRKPFPTEMVEVSGKLYGTITNGGDSSAGVLFEYNPTTNAYNVKVHFGNATGINPGGHLLLASNGKIYGTTMSGGSADRGTLFEYVPGATSITIKHPFNYAAEGRQPRGRLIESATGIIMGVCENGGPNNFNQGTIYEYNLNNGTHTNKASFLMATTGSNPKGGLMKANNGKIYGMTSQGGINSKGTLFEYDPSNTSLTAKVHFNGLNGYAAATNLIQLPNGKLYGSTIYGGVSSGLGNGNFFEYDIVKDSISNILSSFSTNKGKYPAGDLIETGTGTVLILMNGGGAFSFGGSVVEYNISTGSFDARASFKRIETGSNPDGNLVKFSGNGKYYALCAYGGRGDNGTIYEYDHTTGTITNKMDLTPYPLGTNPTKSLVLAQNGKLYGTTDKGGDGYGTVFSINPFDGKITNVANFDGTNGNRVRGSMVLASNGLLYGVTQSGGTAPYDYGVLFQFNPANNSITKLKDIQEITAYYPYAGLVLASNGKLYGTTNSGGTNNYGVLFEYNITANTLTKKADFDAAVTGNSPYAEMIQANNGILYGTCREGGNNSKGTIYSYNINTNTLSAAAHFGANKAEQPRGALCQAQNGKFYGITPFQSSASTGFIYEFDAIGNSISVKYSLSSGGTSGFSKGGNGKLYIINDYFGSSGGVLYEFDPIKDSISVRSSIGISPAGSLVQAKSLNLTSAIYITQKNEATIYPNPANNIINIISNEKFTGVSILNQTGQTVLTAQKSTIDIAHLPTGVYLIQTHFNSGQTLTSRLIKQ